ncbi:MAG: septum formation protein Maf [Proteobacteria bacterium]|nr:MAG: septum formation protein Maf [Pseudomonadota bacterium]
MFKQSDTQRIILASASPRRRELLEGLGLRFKVEPADCDESILPGESPKEMVSRLAAMKAQSLSKRYPEAWIVGADTTVVLDGAILGKPESAEEAASMLGKLSGRWHVVWGGVALINSAKGISHVECHFSEVEMEPMPPEMIAAYVHSCEPMDKAGSYAIQGIGAALVAQVKGSYTNVVGLNLNALVRLLRRFQVIFP